MRPRPVKDLAASVHQRLKNSAKATGRPFNEVLQYFAMERFLYRYSHSEHRGSFVLKGALMFLPWTAALSRPTKDIDFLGHTEDDVDKIVAIVKDICLQDVEPDGLAFDVDSVTGCRIISSGDGGKKPTVFIRARMLGVRPSFLEDLWGAVLVLREHLHDVDKGVVGGFEQLPADTRDG